MDSSTKEVKALVHLLQKVEQALRDTQPLSISPKTEEELFDKLEDVTVPLERALASRELLFKMSRERPRV